jgi:hypothetical protein
VQPSWLASQLPSGYYLLDLGVAGAAVFRGLEQQTGSRGIPSELLALDDIVWKSGIRPRGSYAVMDLQDWGQLLMTSQSPILDPSSWCLVQTPVELWNSESTFPLRRALEFFGYYRVGALPETVPFGLIRFYLGAQPTDPGLLYAHELESLNGAVLSRLWEAGIPFGLADTSIVTPPFFADEVASCISSCESHWRVDVMDVERGNL